jgi:hypothetical protein
MHVVKDSAGDVKAVAAGAQIAPTSDAKFFPTGLEDDLGPWSISRT